MHTFWMKIEKSMHRSSRLLSIPTPICEALKHRKSRNPRPWTPKDCCFSSNNPPNYWQRCLLSLCSRLDSACAKCVPKRKIIKKVFSHTLACQRTQNCVFRSEHLKTKKRRNPLRLRRFLAPWKGFGPPTCRLGGGCSIQLSYQGKYRIVCQFSMAVLMLRRRSLLSN